MLERIIDGRNLTKKDLRKKIGMASSTLSRLGLLMNGGIFMKALIQNTIMGTLKARVSSASSIGD